MVISQSNFHLTSIFRFSLVFFESPSGVFSNSSQSQLSVATHKLSLFVWNFVSIFVVIGCGFDMNPINENLSLINQTLPHTIDKT